MSIPLIFFFYHWIHLLRPARLTSPRRVPLIFIVCSSLDIRRPFVLLSVCLLSQPHGFSLSHAHRNSRLCTVYQRSMPYQARSSARLLTTRGRYSLMRLRTIGRRDLQGTCLRNGTRCCCMGVRKTRSGNDRPSPGWPTSDYPINRRFLVPAPPLYFRSSLPSLPSFLSSFFLAT